MSLPWSHPDSDPIRDILETIARMTDPKVLDRARRGNALLAQAVQLQGAYRWDRLVVIEDEAGVLAVASLWFPQRRFVWE